MYLCTYIATHLHTVYLGWLQAVFERNSRCAWRWWWSELRDTLQGRDRASMEMHLEAEIEWTQRCTWRLWCSEFGDALGGHDRASWGRHLWRPWSSELSDALRGCNRASLEMHLQAMTERDGRSTWRWSIWRRSIGGSLSASKTLLINRLTQNRGNGTRWLYLWSSYWELAGGGRSVGRHAGSWSYIQWSTHHCEYEGRTDDFRYMLCSVYTALGVCCTPCMLH